MQTLPILALPQRGPFMMIYSRLQCLISLISMNNVLVYTNLWTPEWEIEASYYPCIWFNLKIHVSAGTTMHLDHWSAQIAIWCVFDLVQLLLSLT